MAGFLDKALGYGSIASGVLGGVLGTIQQIDTNKTNLRIARETNEANKLMAQNVNDLNYKMFKEQQDYSSPENQRKLLEAAGYNPAVLAGGDYNPISPTPNSATVGNPQIAAHLQAPTAFADQLTKVASNMAVMASAQKANEEAKEIGLRNSVFMTKFDKEMELLGLENEWRKIKNEYDEKNFGLNLKEVGQRIGLNEIEISRKQVEFAIYQKLGEKRAEKEIEHLDQQIKLWAEEGKTEITQQDLNKAMGKKLAKDIELADVEMWLKKYLAPSQKASYEGSAAAGFGSAAASQAQARLTKSQVIAQDIANAIQYAGRGWSLMKIIGDVKQTQQGYMLTFAQRQKIWQECKKLGLEISWYDFQQLNDNTLTQVIAPGYTPYHNNHDPQFIYHDNKGNEYKK